MWRGRRFNKWTWRAQKWLHIRTTVLQIFGVNLKGVLVQTAAGCNCRILDESDLG